MKDKNKEKKKKLKTKRKFSNILFALKEIWSYSPLYLIAYIGSTLLWAPLSFVTETYLLHHVVSGIENQTPVKELIGFTILIGGIHILISTLTQFFGDYVSAGSRERIIAGIRKKLFFKASQVELSCYEDPSFYDQYVKAMDQTSNRVLGVLSSLDNLTWRLVTLFCSSFFLFFIDPMLIVFSLIPLCCGFARRIQIANGHKIEVERKPSDRRRRYVRRVFYLKEYAKELRVGKMAPLMLDELDGALKEHQSIYRRLAPKSVAMKLIQSIGLEVVTIMGSMLYCVWRTVGDGSMSIADCVIILNSIGSISYCLNNLMQSLAEFDEHSLYIEDVRFFLDYEPKIGENPEGADAGMGELTLEDVSFTYSGAEHPSLRHINLRIRPGEHIALVGENGSGKTTLVKLLLRLYDPDEGEIKLNGRDVRDYKLSSYRSAWGCVFQDFKLFSMSVGENVMLRKTGEKDRPRIEEALKESGAWERIQKLEKGQDSILTREFDEKGVNLSVGEQQKVSLARIFASPTPFVILDEPSSALDPIAEHLMFENMMRAAKGRSMIFISHRLSSAVDADRIYLMEKGEIAEEGTHEELMAQNGKYAEMFRFQAENYLGKGDEKHG